MLSDETEAPEEAVIPAQPDAMMADLAERLEALGLQVTLNYRDTIPLAASLNGKAVAVETDYLGSDTSLREALRLHPSVLRRLGWHYVRVHSFDLFADPDAVAERIARTIGFVPQAAAHEAASQVDAELSVAREVG